MSDPKAQNPTPAPASPDPDPKASARAWQERVKATFKRLAEDPEFLASIERRSF